MGVIAKRYGKLSLMDFQLYFPSEAACWDYLVRLRWAQGVQCPTCPGQKQDFIRKRKLFQCRGCRKQKSVTAGTVFHKSRIPLKTWFWAIFLMATSKKGVPMLYLQRQLGIRSYETAWLMGHKIRQAMLKRDEVHTLKGVVQADEILIGGKDRRNVQRTPQSRKTPFLMAVEESTSGRPKFVKVQELEDVARDSLVPAIEKLVQIGSKIKTDAAAPYLGVREKGYELKQSSYAFQPEQTKAHLVWLNTLTSNLKRFLLSTHHGVHPKYRNAYLAEFAYRFNRRYWPQQAFDRLLWACTHSKGATLPELSR
jgi:transposase-like protein